MFKSFLSATSYNVYLRYLLSCVGICLLLCTDLSADTLESKNGNRFEGIITKETNDSIELDMGSGTILFSKKNIIAIHRSNPEELDIVRSNMESDNKKMRARDKEYAEAREKRFNDYDKWARESAAKKASEVTAGGEVQLIKVEGSKDLMAEVMINGNVKATLILDTGAYDILFTRRIGEALGVDFSDRTHNVRMVRLTGKERLTKMVRIGSIRIQDIEEKDLIVAILFEDVDILGLKDGLLGLSYLNRFDCTIDLKMMKLHLQKKQKKQ